jgi:polysaccharide chain length determinant protein (PEP-CTERM system associated)
MPEKKEAAQIDHYLGLIVRKRWLVIIPFCLSMAVGILLAFILPAEYEASTLILVEPQTVPSDYVKSIVSTSIESRITTISQQIKSRSNLEKIFSDFKLFSGAKQQDMFVEDKLESLRSKISVTVVHDRQSSNAFMISFRDNEPKRTMDIANTLASYFINANLKIREEQASGTSKFLEAELESMKKRLEEVEGQLKEFRNQHMGELPEQLDTNLRILGTLESQLNARMARLRDEQLSLTILLTEIEQIRRAEQATGEAGPNLNQLKEQLFTMESTYTSKHPDVIRLKKRIEELELQQSQNRGENAAYRSEVPAALTSPLLREKMRRRMEIEAAIGNSQADIAQINNQMREYKRRIEITPQREEQLLTLNRDYQNMKNAYNSLLNRKLEAEIAVNMEKNSKGEQFRILDYAKLPEKPVSPDLKKLFLMFTAAGLGIGFGVIFLLDMLNPTLQRPDDIESELGIRVLATVPKIHHGKDKFFARLNVGLTALALVVASALVSGFGVLALNGIPSTIEWIQRYIKI